MHLPSAEQAEALGQTSKGSQVQLVLFLALSPTQVVLLSQYPGLPLHFNTSLTTCPFHPLWICTHCRLYLKQSKHRIIKGKQVQKPARQPSSLHTFIFHTEIWKIAFTHWTVATILACVGHAYLHTFLTRHNNRWFYKRCLFRHSGWEQPNTR